MVHSLSEEKRRNCLANKEIGAVFTPGRCGPKSASRAKRVLKNSDFRQIIGKNGFDNNATAAEWSRPYKNDISMPFPVYLLAKKPDTWANPPRAPLPG
jgi:hypothetical protein